MPIFKNLSSFSGEKTTGGIITAVAIFSAAPPRHWLGIFCAIDHRGTGLLNIFLVPNMRFLAKEREKTYGGKTV
jgi:hypothetical protein